MKAARIELPNQLGFSGETKVIQIIEPTLDYGGALSRVLGMAIAARFDILVFTEATLATNDEYTGGTWDMVRLSNGSFFLNWRTDRETIRIVNANNYTDLNVSPVAMSIVATIVALNKLCWSLYNNGHERASKHIGCHYHSLTQAMYDHNESAALISFLD